MKFIEILGHASGGHKVTIPNEDEFNKKFHEWAVSWDCKEAEPTQQSSYLVGDEIGVGALWEDKSQKDFKSYL